MNHGIKLKKATMEDLGNIVSIYNNAIEEMNKNSINQWDHIYPNEKILKDDILRGEMTLGEIDNSIASIFVINKECDEEYQKGDWSCKTESYRVVHRLCVNPRFHNIGIGTNTMILIEEILKNSGVEAIRLDAFSLNPYALKIYENLGYVKVGVVKWRKGLFYLYEKNIR
ncbi:MAG: GNAT family N-acetyltransferase [Clostridium sp.]|uniref:GNAT family N-acetyltransferase n=1 Tax=Clostridium sp. TaxID=1506 RepID=UPI00302DA1D9